MALTPFNTNLDIIAALADEPNDVGGLGAAQLKAKFDEAGNTIKDYINLTLIPEIESDVDAAAQGIGSGGGIDGGRILNNSIADSKIVNLDGGKINDGTIAAAKLVNGGVTRAKLAQDAIMLQTTDFPNKVVPQRALDDNSVSTVKIENDAVTRPKLAANVKVLSFTNVSVASADWELEATPTYADFPYRIAVSLTGVTANHFPQVVLSPTDAMSGAFCPVVDSYEGGVYIYSDGTNEADMTIPVIVCTPVA